MNKTKQRSDEHFNHLQKGQITQINLNTKYDCNFKVYYVFRLSKKEKVYCCVGSHFYDQYTLFLVMNVDKRI